MGLVQLCALRLGTPGVARRVGPAIGVVPPRSYRISFPTGPLLLTPDHEQDGGSGGSVLSWTPT